MRVRQCRQQTMGEAVWHSGKVSACSRPGSRQRQYAETVLQGPV